MSGHQRVGTCVSSRSSSHTSISFRRTVNQIIWTVYSNTSEHQNVTYDSIASDGILD